MACARGTASLRCFWSNFQFLFKTPWSRLVLKKSIRVNHKCSFCDLVVDQWKDQCLVKLDDVTTRLSRELWTILSGFSRLSTKPNILAKALLYSDIFFDKVK